MTVSGHAGSIKTMGVADAGYMWDMSPALPISVPSAPRTFNNRFTFNMFFRAVSKRTMNRRLHTHAVLL